MNLNDFSFECNWIDKMNKKNSIIGILKRTNQRRKDAFRVFRNVRLLSWYYFLYEKKRKRYPVEDINKSKSIGILILGSGIGDAIVMSGLIKILRQANFNVGCICNDKTAWMFKSFVEVDRVDVLPEKASYKKLKDLDLAFDIIVDFSDPEKNLYKRILAICAISHKYLIGYNQKIGAKFYDFNLIRDEKNCHWSKRLITIPEILGIDVKDYKYDIHFTPECINKVDSFIKDLEGEYVIFNPVASDKFRSFSKEFIISTLDYLKEKTEKKIIVYNLKDDDIVNKYKDIIFNPFSDFESCMYLLKNCSLLITPDTSFVHAANFFNIKLIAVYNNRLACRKYCNNVQWGPNYDNATQIFSLENKGTESGDDIRNLPFSVLKDVLDKIKL